MLINFIETHGPKRFEWIEPTPGSYAEQRNRLNAELGFLLPRYQIIKGFGPVDDLRVLCRQIGVFVKFGNTSWVNFSFFPGFVTDLASVPKSFRSVVDNDEHALLPAVLCHDFLFSTHAFPFRYTNRLFHQMSTCNGYSRFKAAVAWLAVSSPWGRKAWHANKQRRRQWTLQTAMMQLPRPFTIDGILYRGTDR